MIDILYEPFRHWSDGGSVYLLSDLHLGDDDCKLMDPDWIEPDEQIRIINKVVNKTDTFVCLGDVGKPELVDKIAAKRKVLIMGNHDRITDYRDIFDEIYSGPLFVAQKILLSHEPIHDLPWCINIHGHEHSPVPQSEHNINCINLAANVFGYTPISLKKLIDLGIISDIPTIHRVTIDRQIERSKRKKQ